MKNGHGNFENEVTGNKILDLCCGSGEVTMALKKCEVIGVDLYTTNAYYNRTGKKPIPLSFKDTI
jgi:ubiquinone/menaquinone biosynthesis C-methylase UbiE